MTTCPHCKGDPDYRTISTAPGFPVQKCGTCGGTGAVTDDHWNRIVDGEVARSMRTVHDESLREMAKRVGSTPAKLSDMEIGRIAVDWPLYEKAT